MYTHEKNKVSEKSNKLGTNALIEAFTTL